MKTLKHKSILGALGLAVLSVFFFTSCEDEMDKPENLSVMPKFKSMNFTGEASTTSTSAGTGTFTGNNSNITYTPEGEENNIENASSYLNNGQAFTDPRSKKENFSLKDTLSESSGGGIVEFNNESYELNYSYKAASDYLGYTDSIDQTAEDSELEVFVGLVGQFNVSDYEARDSVESPLDFIVYVFSYKGGSDIGDFETFNDKDVKSKDMSPKSFVVAVEYNGSIEDGNLYFATEGFVNFTEFSVDLDNIKMAKVLELEDSDEVELGTTEFSLTATFPQ